MSTQTGATAASIPTSGTLSTRIGPLEVKHGYPTSTGRGNCRTLLSRSEGGSRDFLTTDSPEFKAAVTPFISVRFATRSCKATVRPISVSQHTDWQVARVAPCGQRRACR